MSTHAKFSPSKLPALALCPGWKSDPTPGPAAIRGTAVHAYLADVVAGKPVTPPADLAPLVERGETMLADLKAEFPDLAWSAEVRLDTGIPEVYGTADVIGVDPWSSTAVLIDWKTGRGERPDAGASFQVMAYAIGLLSLHRSITRVVCVMGELEQEPTRCEITAGQLAGAIDAIDAIVHKAETHTDADLRPSAKACQYCHRRESCPALRQAVTAAAASVPADPVAAVAALSPEDLAATLAKFRPAGKMVEKFVAALEDRAKELIEAGHSVPGYEIKTSPGARGWTAPDDVVVSTLADWCASTLGAGKIPDFYTLASPAELEKRIAGQVDGKGAKKIAADALRGLCATAQRKSLVEVTP